MNRWRDTVDGKKDRHMADVGRSEGIDLFAELSG